VDYVWDYGSLGVQEEEMYIKSIIGDLFNPDTRKLVVALIATSQECILLPMLDMLYFWICRLQDASFV
jgi:hypothetical protein